MLLLLAAAAASLLGAPSCAADERSPDADSGGGLQQGAAGGGGLQEEGGGRAPQKAELPTLEIDVLRVPAEFFREEGQARVEIRLSGGGVLHPGDKIRCWINTRSVSEIGPSRSKDNEESFTTIAFVDFGDLDAKFNEAHIHIPLPFHQSAGNAPERHEVELTAHFQDDVERRRPIVVAHTSFLVLPSVIEHPSADGGGMRLDPAVGLGACLCAACGRGGRGEAEQGGVGGNGGGACGRYVSARLWAIPVFLAHAEVSVLKSVGGKQLFGFSMHGSPPPISRLFALLPRTAPSEPLGACAVVGNGGGLLMGDFGREIDGHDHVIRINDAPTGGTFAPHVGTRTTHRLVHAQKQIMRFLHSPGGWVDRGYAPERLVFRGDWEEDHQKAVALLEAAIDAGGDADTARENMRFLSLAFHTFAWELIGFRGSDSVPTSGILGILWALQSCETVDTYGFGLPDVLSHLSSRSPGGGGCEGETCSVTTDGRTCVDSEQPSPYKYYKPDTDGSPVSGAGSQAPIGAEAHDWKSEHALLQELESAGLITRRHPPPRCHPTTSL